MRASGLACAFLLVQVHALFSSVQAAPRDPGPNEMTEQVTESKPASAAVNGQVELKYPVTIENVALLDLATGKAQSAKLTAADRMTTLIISGREAITKVDSASITEWSVGDFSETKFSGTNAVAGGLGFAAGALLVPSPATPLLLLLAPFWGMAAGNTYKPDWRMGVREIGVDGREQLVLIQAFTEKDAASIRSVFEGASGLKAGQRRSDAELASVRQQRLLVIEQQLEVAKSPLMRTNTKRPWCTTLDLTGKSDSIETYNRLLELTNILRKSLGKNPYIEAASASSKAKWEDYLAGQPNLAKWAAANGKAASMMERCLAPAAGVQRHATES